MKQLIQRKFRLFAILAAAAIFGPVGAFAQNRAISGNVLDTSGQPVIGAAVTVVGNSRIGAAT